MTATQGHRKVPLSQEPELRPRALSFLTSMDHTHAAQPCFPGLQFLSAGRQ
jgi:hypothetical protein